jgi:hypothetical protein
VTIRQKVGLGALLGAALAVRVLMVFSLQGQPFFDTPIVDSASFDAWAWKIASENFWGDRVFFQDPLYAYFLGIFYKVFGRDFLAARLFQTAVGTFGLWMLFEAARRALGYRAGMIALAIATFTQTFVFYDAMLLKDFLGVVAVEAALLFWSIEARWKWAAFGAALGLGALVRGNMLLLVVAAAGFLAVRREWKPAGLALAGALAVLLPVTVRNAVVGGDFAVTTSHAGVNLYVGNNPENASGRYRPPSFLRVADPEHEESDFRAEAERRTGRPMKPSEVDRYWRAQALDHITGNFGTFLVVTGKRLLMLLNAHEIPDDHNPYFMARFSWVLKLPLFTFGLFIAPLAAAGIFLGRVERRPFGLLHVLAAAYGLSIVFFFVFGRYRLPAVPILVFFAAYAVDAFLRMKGWGMRQMPKAAFTVFAGAAVLVNVPLPASIGGHRDFRAAHYNLGVYYFRHDRPAEAAKEFESAARLNPEYLKDASFVWTLGEACERAGREGDAFEHYDRAASMDVESPEPPYHVGMIYFHRGMHARAAEKLAEAARRDPKFGAAYVPLAEAYRQTKQHALAVSVLRTGAKAVPGDWAIRLKRAEIAREASLWEEALEAARETLALRPGEPSALRIAEEAGKKLRR